MHHPQRAGNIPTPQLLYKKRCRNIPRRCFLRWVKGNTTSLIWDQPGGYNFLLGGTLFINIWECIYKKYGGLYKIIEAMHHPQRAGNIPTPQLLYKKRCRNIPRRCFLRWVKGNTTSLIWDQPGGYIKFVLGEILF